MPGRLKPGNAALISLDDSPTQRSDIVVGARGNCILSRDNYEPPGAPQGAPIERFMATDRALPALGGPFFSLQAIGGGSG
jgi:hypothetical protein